MVSFIDQSYHRKVLNFVIKFKQIQTDYLDFFIPENGKHNALIHFEDAHLANFSRKTMLKIFLKFSSNIFCRNSEF